MTNISSPRNDAMRDVIIVGAGAAGVGCGVVLKHLGFEQFAILERHRIGASFARWPKEMRFITPSFTSNAFGLMDLNSAVIGSSPAFGARREHFDGPEYVDYLTAMADHFKLPIELDVDVIAVHPLPNNGGFAVHTTQGIWHSRFVIWAAGEFQYPRSTPFPGAELCLHNAQVDSWAELAGDEFLVIGGAESGIDAAVTLSNLGKEVTILDSKNAWENESSDPSLGLSPYTLERLEAAQSKGNLHLRGGVTVSRVTSDGENYTVYGDGNEHWTSKSPPVLATGFVGSLSLIRHLFTWSEDGFAQLSEEDESTLTPGLFVSGPMVRHKKVIFCFIYKFRQRFAVVANTIAQRLGRDTAPLQTYRQKGMYLDDLSCCEQECIC